MIVCGFTGAGIVLVIVYVCLYVGMLLFFKKKENEWAILSSKTYREPTEETM